MNLRARAVAPLVVVLLAMSWVLLTPVIGQARQKNLAFKNPTEEVAGAPRVLIIGDSVSIGYTQRVREELVGEANVHRIRDNAGHTGMGLEKLDAYLDPKLGNWDIIHFNFGLWDLCYRNPKSKTQGNRDKVGGTLTHTPEQYRANLANIVERLQKTGAELIFATTTPIPEQEAGRKLGDDVIYNSVAIKLMELHSIRVNDLYSIMSGSMQQYAKGPGDVHFTDEGSGKLAQAVAEAIRASISEN